MLLPIPMEFNVSVSGTKYKDIANTLGIKGVESMTQDEYRKAAINAVKQLSVIVRIPEKCE